jgi:glycosyltransferase involved in cell wall biosynthesis
LGAPAKAGHTPTRLLYTGTLSASRGLRTMVKLAARIRRAGRPETIDLVGICRYEKQRAWAKARIQEEDLNSILSRVGWDTYVPPSTMPPYYRRADVGLALFEPHPNHRGSIPTKFYEYLHYGLPLICSDIPRWRRFVERHACGAVVPPGEPAAVLDVLDEWRAHPERYRERAERARAAASRYRWKPVGQRLATLYRQVLNEKVTGASVTG